MAPERRANSDTVAIPRQAITFLAALAALLLGGVGSVLWSVTSASISVDQRLSHIEAEINKGDRFTAAEGEAHDDRLKSLEKWRQEHTEFGYDVVGRWTTLHREYQRRLDRLENDE